MYRANVMLWSSYDGIPVTNTRDSFDVIMHTKLTADDDDANDDSDWAFSNTVINLAFVACLNQTDAL